MKRLLAIIVNFLVEMFSRTPVEVTEPAEDDVLTPGPSDPLLDALAGVEEFDEEEPDEIEPTDTEVDTEPPAYDPTEIGVEESEIEEFDVETGVVDLLDIGGGENSLDGS